MYIYIYNYENMIPCAHLVINAMALWQIMCFGTSCVQMHELPENHFSDNLEVALFS